MNTIIAYRILYSDGRVRLSLYQPGAVTAKVDQIDEIDVVLHEGWRVGTIFGTQMITNENGTSYHDLADAVYLGLATVVTPVEIPNA